MTMILEIPPDLQAKIELAANQRGTDAQAFVLEATRWALETIKPLPKGSRRAAIEAARGSLQGLISTDEFLAERHAEAEREREKDEAINWTPKTP